MITAFMSSKGQKAALPYIPHLERYCEQYSINTPKRLAAFLANIAHESAEFTRVEENLNYSAERLAKVWPNRFRSYDGSPNEKANSCAHNPEKLGNFVYANRMGNGNELSGDGYKHRGLGLAQLTGKDNHVRCGKAIGRDLLNNPELLLTPDCAVESACWFYNSKNLNKQADKGDIFSVRKIWNGGLIGMSEVQSYYDKLCKLLGG